MAKKRPETGDLFNSGLVRDVLPEMVRRLIPELDNEPDEKLALRKAVLALILALQHQDVPGAKDLISYLLMSFKPVAGCFEEHRHPFLGNHEAARARRFEGDGFVLGLPVELLGELGVEPKKLKPKKSRAD